MERGHQEDALMGRQIQRQDGRPGIPKSRWQVTICEVDDADGQKYAAYSNSRAVQFDVRRVYRGLTRSACSRSRCFPCHRRMVGALHLFGSRGGWRRPSGLCACLADFCSQFGRSIVESVQHGIEVDLHSLGRTYIPLRQLIISVGEGCPRTLQQLLGLLPIANLSQDTGRRPRRPLASRPGVARFLRVRP